VSRDRDVRNAVQTALTNTGVFDGVFIWGLPADYGTGSSKQAECIIIPQSSRQEDFWDAAPAGGLVITSRVGLTLAYRNNDPQARDEGAELLLENAANALNGQSLGDLTFPQTTRIIQWDWQEPVVPERRIIATLTYQYLIEGWDAADVTA
jgi:hypothetical protein